MIGWALATALALSTATGGQAPLAHAPPEPAQIMAVPPALHALVQERVIERTAAYLIDGLSGEPVSVKRDLVLTADDLDDNPRLVLNPDSDIDIDIGPDDTARFLGVDPVRPERESTLLSVLGVESTTKPRSTDGRGVERAS